MDDETKLTSNFPTMNAEANSLPVTSENTSLMQTEINPQISSNNFHSDIGINYTTQVSCDGVFSYDQMNKISPEAINPEGSAPENIGCHSEFFFFKLTVQLDQNKKAIFSAQIMYSIIFT